MVKSTQPFSSVAEVTSRLHFPVLQTGISFAIQKGAEYVVTFDADGQHDPRDLPALLARAGLPVGQAHLLGEHRWASLLAEQTRGADADALSGYLRGMGGRGAGDIGSGGGVGTLIEGGEIGV